MAIFKLGAKPLPPVTHNVPLPGFDDVQIRVRELLLSEVNAFTAKSKGQSEKTLTDLFYDLLALVILDEDGNKMFADGEAVKNGLEMPAKAFIQFVEMIAEVVGLSNAKKN